MLRRTIKIIPNIYNIVRRTTNSCQKPECTNDSQLVTNSVIQKAKDDIIREVKNTIKKDFISEIELAKTVMKRHYDEMIQKEVSNIRYTTIQLFFIQIIFCDAMLFICMK